MSLSNPTVSQNPATKFISFKGDTGEWYYYDKTKEENVVIKPPIYFIILDELSTVKGWSDQYSSGIYSNEVHTLSEQLTVKTFKGGAMIKGWYQDIKNDVKALGGKYTKSIYAMLIHDDDNTELVNFQLSGAAFSAYLDYKFKIDGKVVGILEEVEEAKKGSIKYFKPKFKLFKPKENLTEMATEMDKELQAYFKTRKPTEENEKEESDPYKKVEGEFDEMQKKIEDKNKENDPDDVGDLFDDAEEIEEAPF